MVLSDISIRRPVLATVMSLVVCLLGLIAFDRLTVREYPNIDPPVVNVSTTYKGASAEIIESQVTQVLEDSLAGIEGIDIMTSVSRPETSRITVKFRLDRDAEAAANDVRDRVSRVRSRLPDEIDEPVIAKVEADAQPIMYLAFSSDRHSELEITDFADRFVKDKLQSLPGVAEIRVLGERRYAMRVWLDPARLAAYRVTPGDVETALRRQNVEVPSGRIESSTREFTVLSKTDLRTPAEFDDIILREDDGYLVRLKDVGRAAIEAESIRRIARFKGKNAVGLGVVKQATANPLDVAGAVRVALPDIEGALPDGMRVDIGYDSSVYIAKSIESVYTTIGEAIILVVAIIFLLLQSGRATVIPMVTIPVSLIGAFAIMQIFGFSINTLSLLALVLAIGLVVDDAIVMMENIFRHIEDGVPPMEAALKGSKEIGFAVLAMTVTLAAVFIPVGFMTGTTGQLFTEFAWTLAGAVLVSGFVALTLSPMMCAKMLRHEKKHSWAYRKVNDGLEGVRQGYARILGAALNARLLVIAIGLAVAGSSYFLFTSLKSELAPIEDRGTVVTVGLAPEGATIDYTDAYAQRIEELFAQVPEIDRYFMVVGFPVVSQSIAFAGLVGWDERTRKQQEIVAELAPKIFGGIPGLLAFPVNPPSLGQSAVSKPVQFVIQNAGSYEDLERIVAALMEEARKFPGFTNLDTDLKLNQPQLEVAIDRDKAADVGVEIETIGRTLETLLGGRNVTRFKRDGEQYEVVVQLADVDRRNPDDLARIYVRGTGGQMVQLSNLVRLTETVAPKELNHFGQLRSAKITAALAPGYTLGEGLGFLEAAAKRALPPSAQTDLDGQSREFRESSASLYVTFLLALAFIYLVLAAQFESFVDPLIIMLTVPLSITGALLALYLTGGTLNIYSQIGLVTLIGLITKHGILMVEFANQLQAEGRPMREAVIEAASIRLRPILMTTGAMVLGSIPLALATGAGAESRQQIGWVIVGGLLVGTFFTLLVIPTAYTLISRKRPAAERAAPRPAPAE